MFLGSSNTHLRVTNMIELQIHDEVAAFIKDEPKLSAELGKPWVVFAEQRF
jgi:hypothetical protein